MSKVETTPPTVPLRIDTALSFVLGALTVIAGLLGLAGWDWHASPGVSRWAEFFPVAPLAGLMFLLLGAAIMLGSPATPRPGPSRLAAAFALVVVVGAGLRLILHAAGIDWPGQHPDARELPGIQAWGPALPAAAPFALLAGGVILAAQVKRLAGKWPLLATVGIAWLLWSTALVFLLRHLLGPQLLDGDWRTTPALGTTLGLVPLSIALVLLTRRSFLAQLRESRPPGVMLGLFFVLLSGVVAAGSIYYNVFENQFRQANEKQLAGILGAKARRLADWRAERLNDGDFYFENPLFVAQMRRILTSADPQVGGRSLAVWLQRPRQQTEYDQFRLMDAAGRTVVSYPEGIAPASRDTREAVAVALHARQPALQDVYWHERDGRPYLAVIVPVIGEPDQPPLGAVVLRIDPERRFFQLVATWPLPGAVAEVMLVRPERQAVVQLNSPLRPPGPATQRKILADARAPELLALAHPLELVAGPNDRREPVFCIATRVPDSPWQLVVSISQDSADQPLRERMWGTLLFAALIVVAIGAALGMVWRQQRARFFQQRLKAAQSLYESDRRFRSVLESIALIGLVLDVKGRITVCNEFLLTLTGWKSAEVIGRNWFELFVPPEVRAEIESPIFLKSIASGAIPSHYENEIVTRSGQRRLVAWHNAVLRDFHGTVTGVASIGEDITERRALESRLRQAQKMEVVGQLAGGVAHDFNNILTAITLNVGLLRESTPPGPARQSVQEIEALAGRAASLTQRLLMFARRQAIQLVPVDLNAALANLLQLLRRLLGEHIALSFSPGTPAAQIAADPGMLDQIVMNLCINARDAMPHGGVLSLSTQVVTFDATTAASVPEARPGRFVCLTVRDTGVGMPPEVTRHLFEPFFTTKEIGKGTGLGLASVHGIVHQHQGWVTAESEVGKGSTFRVYLPVSAIPDQESPVAAPAEAAPLRGQETILLVEDEHIVRKATTVILQQMGYRVLVATDSREALQVWAEHSGRIDLLFSDLVMPGGMTGLQLGGRLRQEKPALKVLLMSGYSAEIIRSESLDPGIFFLPKPFDSATLAKTLHRCFERATGG